LSCYYPSPGGQRHGYTVLYLAISVALTAMSSKYNTYK